MRIVPAVRIRIQELLAERGWTPYALSKATAGRVSLSTAHRLKRLEGRVKTFDAEMLEVLMDTFRLKSLDELLEREPKKRGRA